MAAPKEPTTTPEYEHADRSMGVRRAAFDGRPLDAPSAQLWRKTQQTVAMFVSRQVIEKLEGEQSELRREVKYLRRAVERGDNMAVKAHAEDLASRIENHASLVDAVLEAVSEDT